jgi:Leucine-rich repeat (LRR) protein
MKTLILLIPVLAMVSISNAQNVNIPSTHFKNALISAGIDKNKDGELSYAECAAIKELDISQKDITDLTGIEAFINLDTLNCSFNQLISLDVSNNTALTDLYCDGNQLTSLDVSNNTALTTLGCSGNQLTSLDVSNNTALIDLSCSNNQLTSLDVSSNTALTGLYCYGNQLTSLDVSNNTALTALSCGGNQLTSLDISGCTAFTELNCYGNQLTSLDVSNNSALTVLSCGGNQLTSLDVSGCISLHLLDCGSNQLTNLDVSDCGALYWLNCGSNQLTSLNISKNKYLFTNFSFYDSYLYGILDLSHMPTLYEVCIWEMPFPPAEKVDQVDTTGSPNVHFTMDCLATDLNATEENSNISVYPNPATAFFTFDLKNISESAMVELFDLQGKKVLEQKLSENKQISVSNLPKGLYMYKINNGGKLYTGKIAVE